jgi:ABC-2 type transport system permease protein
MTTLDPTATATTLEPRARELGPVNWLGIATLAEKEVRRFLKVWTQTLAGPVCAALLFLGIFVAAVGASLPTVSGLAFVTFMAPGLIMMTVVQNAFANTSSSLMIAKVQGNIVDLLMPPLTPAELLLGYLGGGLARGLVLGLVLGLILLPIAHYQVHDLGLLLLHVVGGSLLMSLLGLIAGIIADKIDHLAAFTNFVVTPLAFLSGTFYSIHRLPEWLQLFCQLNPIFYLIDGFRYGLTGHADGVLWVGALVVWGLVALLWLVCHRMLRTGYKLKP